jgi:colanic acid biosynthesis glycosyl transferase WcaI
MRILFISQYFHPEQFSNNNIVRFLRERGHDVDVLTAIPNYPEGKIFEGYGLFKNRTSDYHGAQVTRVPVIPRGQRNLLKLSANYISFALCGSVWALLPKFRKADVIFCSVPSPITMAIPAIAAKKLSGRPLVIWMQDLWPESVYAIVNIESGLAKRLLERLCKFIYQSADLTLVQSTHFETWILKYAPASRFGYLPNTVENYQRPLPANCVLR